MANLLTQEEVDESLANAIENHVDVRVMAARDVAIDMCRYDSRCEDLSQELFPLLVSMVENWQARNPPV